MRIHKVYIYPRRQSFIFSVTWIDGAGTLHPEGSQIEIAYPLEAIGREPEDLWDVYVRGIKLELERSAPSRAERLNLSTSDYYAAVDEWGGDIVVI